jgi:hypothetical protein
MTRRSFLVAAGAAPLAAGAAANVHWKQEPLRPGEITLGNDLFGERWRLNAR